MMSIKKLKTMKEIQDLVLSHEQDWEKYGNVKVTSTNGILLFAYTREAMFQTDWNWFEKVSRGLLIDERTAEILARPFDKFFNWGEKGQRRKTGLVEITEKCDGSLGILYRQNGQFKIATRGSLNSDQAIWATEFLKRYDLSSLPNELTLIFEIIYPENRIVVNYEGRSDLVLLGVRNRFTGEDWFSDRVAALAKDLGFSSPIVYALTSVDDLLERTEHIPANEEGWVVRFKNGQRLKIKGKAYLNLHRLLLGHSEKGMLQELISGKYEEYARQIPEEFRSEIDEMKKKVDEESEKIHQEIETLWSSVRSKSRKEIALEVQRQQKQYLMQMIMCLFEGRDFSIEKLLFERLNLERKEQNGDGEKRKTISDSN